MNLLLLIILMVGIPAWIYQCTRIMYGDYEYVEDERDWLFGGYSYYVPGALKPIHFVKCVLWHLFIAASTIGLWVFIIWASGVEV